MSLDGDLVENTTLLSGGSEAGTIDGRRPAARSAGLCRAWRAVRVLNLRGARRELEAAEQAMLLGEPTSAAAGYGDLCAIRAVTLMLEDDSLSAAAAAEQAVRRGASVELARFAHIVLRYCSWKAGGAPVPASDSTLCALETTGLLRPTSPNATFADVLDLTLAAAIELSRLQLTSAEGLARCALRRAEGFPAMSAWPASTLARILYERGVLDEAGQLLRPRLPIIRAVGGLDCVSQTFRVLARLAVHNGDRASALRILDEGCELAQARSWPRLLAALLAERIRLCGKDDEVRAASCLSRLRNLAERHAPPVRCALSDVACHYFSAQLCSFLTFKTETSCRAAIAYLRHEASLRQDLHSLACVALAEAQVIWAEGDQDRSIDRLSEILRSAEAAGLRQQLVDAGPSLRSMIERFLRRGGIEQRLLAFAICVADGLPRPVVQGAPRRRTRGGNELTTREQEILGLIADGRTNKAIAQTTGVAPETIKTHLKNIFAKLGVERRAQAVARAERSGLIGGRRDLSHRGSAAAGHRPALGD